MIYIKHHGKSRQQMEQELSAILHNINTALESIQPTAESCKAYNEAISAGYEYLENHWDFPEVEGLSTYFRRSVFRRNKLEALYRAYGWHQTYYDWFQQNYKPALEFGCW
jgi:hypothetical protein